jgi:hypothetical protein
MCAEFHKMAGRLTTCGSHSSPYCIWVISSQVYSLRNYVFSSTSNSNFKCEQEDALCYENSAQAPPHQMAWQNWNVNSGATNASPTKSNQYWIAGNKVFLKNFSHLFFTNSKTNIQFHFIGWCSWRTHPKLPWDQPLQHANGVQLPPFSNMKPNPAVHTIYPGTAVDLVGIWRPNSRYFTTAYSETTN